MKTLTLIAISGVMLSACVPSATPEQKSVYAGNLVRASAAPASRFETVVNSTYVVEPNGSRTMAFVTPVGGTQHNIDRIEQAAAQHTGCGAKARPDLYEAMRGNPMVSIPQVRLQRLGGRFGVDLTC